MWKYRRPKFIDRVTSVYEAENTIIKNKITWSLIWARHCFISFHSPYNTLRDNHYQRCTVTEPWDAEMEGFPQVHCVAPRGFAPALSSARALADCRVWLCYRLVFTVGVISASHALACSHLEFCLQKLVWAGMGHPGRFTAFNDVEHGPDASFFQFDPNTVLTPSDWQRRGFQHPLGVTTLFGIPEYVFCSLSLHASYQHYF